MAQSTSNAQYGLLGQTNGLAAKSPLAMGTLNMVPAGHSILPPTPKPSTPVKSVSIDPDGTQTVSYHAPSTNSAQAPASSAGQSIQQTIPSPATGAVQTPSGAIFNTNTGQTTPPPQVAPTFSGLVGSLANFQTPASTQANSQAQQAFAQTQAIQDELEQSRQNESRTMSTLGSQAIPLGDITGRQQVAANLYQTQQNALAQRASAESALYGPALSSATAGQGQQESALASAVGAAQPSGNFPFSFNPLTGQFSNGSGGNVGLSGNYGNDTSTMAQAVMSGKISYSDAQSALSSYYGNTANGNLTAAIVKAGGNPTQLQAQASGAAAGTQAIAGAGGTGAANVLQTIPAMQSANVAAKGIQNTITTLLAQNPQLNPNVAAAGNAFLQFLQGKQLSDPSYQTLANDINEYANTLAPILGVGGDPTNFKTSIAQSMINAQASGGSIATVLTNLSQLADQKVQNLQAGATGSTSPTSGSSGSFVEGQSVSSGGYNFVFQNGKWVAK